MTDENVSQFDINLDPEEAGESVKPNSTITRRQKQLLDQMANSRFASRSEALRAAIEVLRERLEENGNRPIDELRIDIQSLESTVDELVEQVEVIHSALITPEINSVIEDDCITGDQAQFTDQRMDASSSHKLANAVHKSVLELEIPTITNIADHCEMSSVNVHKGLSQLEGEGLVVSSEKDGQVEYQISTLEA